MRTSGFPQLERQNGSHKTETISGDRRSDRRYQINLEMRYKLIRRKKVLGTGTGRTIDLSSGGILVETDSPLPVGLNLELHVTWPILLHNTAPLQLVASGRIVRGEGNRAGIRMVQHEFRTMGTQADDQKALAAAARTPSPLLANSAYAAFNKFQ